MTIRTPVLAPLVLVTSLGLAAVLARPGAAQTDSELRSVSPFARPGATLRLGLDLADRRPFTARLRTDSPLTPDPRLGLGGVDSDPIVLSGPSDDYLLWTGQRWPVSGRGAAGWGAAPWLTGSILAGYLLLLALVLRGLQLLRLQHVEAGFAVLIAERNRVARELHDTVMQSLAGIQLQLDDAERKLGERPGELRQAIARSLDLVATAHGEVRRSVWGLRSGVLEDQDLDGALRAQARQLARGTGVEIESRVEGDRRRLAPQLELELLRIGQEATTNALKHGRARRISLITSYLGDRVRVVVRDDGKGFSGQTRARGGGFGLDGMRERARTIGATLEIASAPGAGTEVRVEAPAPGAGR